MGCIAKIDKGACIAQGDCVEIAPEAFALGRTAEVIGTAEDEKILKAAKSCPTEAIEVIDSETGDTIFP